MNSLLKSVIIISAIFLYAGCIDLETLVIVNPDGSGTVQETLLMNSEIVNMIKEFSGSFSEDTTAIQEEFSLFDEEDLKKRSSEFGAGVKYQSGEKLIKDGKEGYKAIYTFTDINNLVIDQNPGSKISLDETEAAIPQDVEKENIVFSFQRGNPALLTIDMPVKMEDEDSTISMADTAETDTSNFDQLMSFMKDMKISFLININGKIAETNATHINDSTVTLMSFNFGDLMKDAKKLEVFKAINPQNMQQLKEVMKGIPGIKIEFENPVIIKFQ